MNMVVHEPTIKKPTNPKKTDNMFLFLEKANF